MLLSFLESYWKRLLALLTTLASFALALGGAISATSPQELAFWFSSYLCCAATAFLIWSDERQKLNAALARLKPKVVILERAEVDPVQLRCRIRVQSQSDVMCKFGAEVVKIDVQYFPAPLPFALRLIPESDQRTAQLPARGERTVDVLMDFGDYDSTPLRTDWYLYLYFCGIGDSLVRVPRRNYRITIRAYIDGEGEGDEKTFDVIVGEPRPVTAAPDMPDLRFVPLESANGPAPAPAPDLPSLASALIRKVIAPAVAAIKAEVTKIEERKQRQKARLVAKGKKA
jgi:hypothetical protein